MNGFAKVRAASTALVLATAVGLGVPASTAADEARAQATTESLISALLAAVLDITSRTTPESIESESHAISLLLPRSQRAYRVLDASGEPLNPRNEPRGRFQREAVEAAIAGETTQVVRGGKLLTVVPLPFADANCAACHGNYLDFEPEEVVGAIYLRVPIEKD